jgi:pimeloyl-ACP methyl ester carboxylesterase
VSERACTFGSQGGLVGILCEPLGGSVPSLPGVLLLNAGLDHHVGPNRLNVDLARHLAGLGFTSLRFDLSGLGDSEPRRDQRSDEERAVADVADAMDFLGELRGVSGFVVIALCSGVDPAHAVAVRDPRVRGAVFLNGYEYPTARTLRRHRLLRARRALVPACYARLLRRWLRRAGRPEVGRGAIFVRSYPPVARFREDLRAMLARGTELLFLYTRHHYDLVRIGQFTDMIGEPRVPPGIEVEYWPGLDHVLTPVAERRRAVGGIGAWALARFGGEAAADGAARPVG